MGKLEEILREILQQVNEYRSDYTSNEQAVRTQLIEPVLNALGWITYNPRFVRPNAPNEDGKIPDYTLLKDKKTLLIIEAKNLSIDLQNKNIIDQLANYCFKTGIDFGILTNGMKWLLFKTFEKDPKDRIIWEVDLEKDKVEHVSMNLASFSYDNIEKLESLLKKSKTLDLNWKQLIGRGEGVITIISEKLLETIRKSEPNFKIAEADLKTFTKGKLVEYFELKSIEEEDKEFPTSFVKKESEFEDVETSIFKRQVKNKIREKISVTFPDQAIIKQKKVVDTFIESIAKIGVEKVKSLNIYRSGIEIVSETKDNLYNQHRIGKYWIMTNTSTKEKVSLLLEINERLNLNLKVETFISE